MNCSACQKNLIAYQENNLPGAMRDDTVAHLDNCSQCSGIYYQMKLAFQIIEEEKAIVSNPFLTTRVMAIIENHEIQLNKEPAFKRIIQNALVALAISVAVFGGIEAGNLYTTGAVNKTVPDEMVFMNDATLESLSLYSTE